MARHGAPSGVPGRPVRVRSGTILALVAAGVAVALVAGAVAGALREPASLDPDTPEGVVQAYLQAVLDGDEVRALDYLTREAARRCEVEAFGRSRDDDSTTATLESSEVSGDRAEIRVRLHTVSGPPPPLGAGGRSYTQRFQLVREDGAWRLDGPNWPLYHCPERD